MAVDRLALLGREAVQEPFEQGRLAHAAGAGDQAQLAALIRYSSRARPSSMRWSCHKAVTAACSENGWLCELKVVQVHQSFLS